MKHIEKLLKSGIPARMPKTELNYAYYDDNKIIFTDTRSMVILNNGDEIKAHFKDIGGNFYNPKTNYFEPLAGIYPDYKRIIPNNFKKSIKVAGDWSISRLYYILATEANISFDATSKTLKAYLEYIKGQDIIINTRDESSPFVIEVKDSKCIIMPIYIKNKNWEVV